MSSFDCEDRGQLHSPDDASPILADGRHEYTIDIHLSVAVSVVPSAEHAHDWRTILAENAQDAMGWRDGFADSIDGWHVLEAVPVCDVCGQPRTFAAEWNEETGDHYRCEEAFRD